MATQTQQEQLLQLGITMFDRSFGKESLDFLEGFYDDGMTIEAMATTLSTHDIFTSQFSGLTNEEIAEELIGNYGLTTNTSSIGDLAMLAEAGSVKAFFLEALNTGVNIGQAVIAANDAFTNDAGFQAAFPLASGYLANATEVSAFYAITNEEASDSASVLASVTADADSVDTAKAAIDAGDAASTIIINSNDMTGTDADNTFVSRDGFVSDATFIDGGKGTNTVELLLDDGESAISPVLTNIDILEVRAQDKNTSVDSGTNDVKNATIDAQDMGDVSQYWSVDSRADVVIEDVHHISTDTTIGMRSTENGDVDMEVYFDSAQIDKPDGGTTGGKLFIKVADLDQIKADSGSYDNAVEDFPYDILKFTFNDVTYSIDIDYDGVEDHADMVVAINEALKTAETGGSTVDLSETLSAKVAGTFNATHPDTQAQYNSIPTIEINKLANVEGNFSSAANWDTSGIVDGDTAYYTRVSSEQSVNIQALTMTNVILDDVGQGSQGGSLTIGNDSTGVSSSSKGIEQFNIDVERTSNLNVLQSTNNTLEVVNVENVTGFDGDLTIDSLTDVRVFDANGHDEGDYNGMTGSVTLNAELTAAVSDKYLNKSDTASNPSADNSELSYHDVADNEFSYDFGRGNDTLNLTISNANLAVAGSTTREDFELTIDGGAGNDIITTIIGNGAGAAGDAWYINSKLNANLEIDAGAGDDTVTTLGAGDFVIDAGTGADTVYTDNSAKETAATTTAYGVAYAALTTATTGLQDVYTAAEDTYNAGMTNANLAALNAAKANLEAGQALVDSLNDGKAVFVFNTEDQTTASDASRDINDLVSNAATTTAAVNLGLTVTFKGVTTDISEVANSFGSDKLINVTNLQINQAIKDAINNDDALAKFLVAEDGPANTLVVKSLIDGSLATTDLAVNFGQLTYTAPVTGQVSDAWDISSNDVSKTVWDKQITDGVAQTGVAATIAATTDYTTALATANGSFADVTGIASTAVSANTVNLGAGDSDDVLVLGTLAAGDDTSKDTVIYEDANFGDDTILNFETSNDKLDFSAFVTTLVGGTSIVEAGAGTLADTFNVLYDASSTTNTNLAIAEYIANGTQATAAGSSTSVVFLTNDASNDGKAYAYQITDAVGANTANATVSATLLGSIDLGDSATGGANFDVTDVTFV